MHCLGLGVSWVTSMRRLPHYITRPSNPCRSQTKQQSVFKLSPLEPSCPSCLFFLWATPSPVCSGATPSPGQTGVGVVLRWPRPHLSARTRTAGKRRASNTSRTRHRHRRGEETAWRCRVPWPTWRWTGARQNSPNPRRTRWVGVRDGFRSPLVVVVNVLSKGGLQNKKKVYIPGIVFC